MRTDKRGFTLVELLVVISVLALLAGMVVPALHGVWDIVNGSATRAQMGSLSIAIRQYSETFHTLPPSNKKAVAVCAGEVEDNGTYDYAYAKSGAESLCFFLRGWYLLDNGEVKTGEGYKISDLGDRTRLVKPMYPLNKDEEQSAHEDSDYGFTGGSTDGKFFADKFGTKRPILYFKAFRRVEGGIVADEVEFDVNHNIDPIKNVDPDDATDNRWLAPGVVTDPEIEDTIEIENTFKSKVTVNGTIRSVEFILWSAGPDGLFMNDDDIIVSP